MEQHMPAAHQRLAVVVLNALSMQISLNAFVYCNAIWSNARHSWKRWYRLSPHRWDVILYETEMRPAMVWQALARTMSP